MIELFVVAYLKAATVNQPAVVVSTDTVLEFSRDNKRLAFTALDLDSACKYARGREGGSIFHVLLSGTPIVEEITCKWVEEKKAHWEAEPILFRTNGKVGIGILREGGWCAGDACFSPNSFNNITSTALYHGE